MKKTGRILSIVLSIAMLITSCPEVLLAGVNESSEPQSSYETSVDTYDANIVENNDENTIDDEKEAVIDNESANDSEVDSNDDSNVDSEGVKEDEETLPDESLVNEDEETLEDESMADESVDEIEEILEEDPEYLYINADTESSSAGQLESEGWSWDKTSKTLTLKGANIPYGLIIGGTDAIIDVQTDSTISNAEGKGAKNTLTIEDGITVTIKGGHKLTLGSNSVTSGSMNAVYLYDNSSLHICDGTKVYISNFASYIPIGMHDYGVLSMTGEGTEINISTPAADTVRKAIHAYGNGSAQGKSPELKINDGATLSFTTGTTSETGAIRVLENSTAKVDLRGGNVVVNNIGKCNTNNPLLVANSIRYDDDATFVNSAMTTGTSNKLWIVSGPLTGTEEAPATYSYTGTNSPRFVAVNQPEKLTAVKAGSSTGNPTLKFELSVLNGTADGDVTYIWKKDGEVVDTNTTGTYTIPALEAGLYKYTCEASATSGGRAIEETSKEAVVIASEAGKKITTGLEFDETSESVDKLSEYGYKYDKETGTLILAGAVIYGQVYLIGAKAYKVVLQQGTDNYIYMRNTLGGFAIGFNCMNSEISGTGTLHLDLKDHYQTKGIYTLNYNNVAGRGEVDIKGGAQIDINMEGGLPIYIYYHGVINVDGEGTKVNIKKTDTVFYTYSEHSVVYADTASGFNLTNKAELTVDYENKDAEGAIIYGYYKVKNVSVTNGAKVTANVQKFMPLLTSNGTVDICGGNLSLHSQEACSAAGTKSIYIYQNTTSPASFTRSDDTEIDTTGLSDFTEAGVTTNGAVTDVSITSTSGPRLRFATNPATLSKVLKNDPNTPYLTVEVKAYEMASNQAITYQWYSCDATGENATKISGAITAKYKLPKMTEYGSEYFYCLATAKYNAKTYSKRSNIAEVQAVSKLTTPRTSSLGLDNATADSENTSEGWNYDYDTKTLTLNNFELTNGRLSLPANATIVLADGSVNILNNNSNDYPLYTFNGTLTIKGNGVLEITGNRSSGNLVETNYSTLNIEGNALVHIKPTEGKQVNPARIAGGNFKVLAPEDLTLKSGAFYHNDKIYYRDVWLSGTDSTTVVPKWKEISGPVAVKQNETATLSAEAEMTGSTSLRYSWRVCDENGATTAVLDGQKGKILTIADTATLGTTYYYCRVTGSVKIGATTYDVYIDSDIMSVTVNESGRVSRRKTLDLESATTDCKNSAEGWTYKAATKTLTLDNADLGPATSYTIAVRLPADATIVLADGSENVLSGGIRTNGNLTIEGSGSLKADMALNVNPLYVFGQLTIRNNADVNLTNDNSSYSAVYCKYLKVEHSTLKTKTKCNTQVNIGGDSELALVGSELEKGTYESYNSGIYGVATEDSYYEISIVPNDDPVFTFDKDINYRSTYATSIGATAPSLSVHAEVKGSNAAVTYQWYEVSSFRNPINNKTAVNGKQASYTPANTTRGMKYYMCAAEATINGKKQTIYSNVCAVVTAAKGKKPVIGELEVIDNNCYIYNYEGSLLDKYAADKWIEYGISYTAKTDTDRAKLVLTDVTICNAFSYNSSYGDGLFINVETDVVITDGTSTYIYAGSDGINTLTSCTISGTGKLVTEGTQGARNNTTTKREGEFLVKDTTWELNSWSYVGYESIVFDNAKVRVDGSFGTYYACGNLKLKNGATLNVTDRADICGNLEIDENSAAYIHSTGSTALNMADAANQTMTVNGILSVSVNTTSQIRTILFTGLTEYDAAHMTNQGTSAVRIPEGGLTSADYSYSSYGGMGLTTTDEVLFAPATFQKKAVTAIAKPTGTAAVSMILTAGALTPSDATVTYQWQYASTANAAEEFWQDIYSEKDASYLVSGTYENKYLRVKAMGYGEYTGTVYSTAVGPICGNPGGLSSLILDRNTSTIGSFSGSVSSYTGTVYKMPDADGSMPTMTVQAVPVSSDATVTIRNVTEAPGFNPAVINGTSGEIELYTDGEVGFIINTILVEVYYQGKTTTYTVSVYVRIADAAIKLYGRSTGSVIASWNDGTADMAVNTAGVEGNTVTANIKPGTEVTVTVVAADGFYLKKFLPYSGMDVYNDALTWDEDGNRVVKFIMPNDPSTINLHAENAVWYGVKPPTMDAGWAYNSSTDSYYIRVNGEMLLTSEDYYGKAENPALYAKLYDAAGNEVELRNDLMYSGKYFYGFADGLWTDSGDIYAWDDETKTKYGLDPTQTYTLKLGYKYTNSTEDVSDSLQTIVLNPVKDTVKVELSKHYLAVPVPASEVKTYEIPLTMTNLKSSAGAGMVEIIGNVDDHMINAYASNEMLYIQVPPEAVPKVYYVTIRVDAGANNFVLETLKLDVQDENANAKAYFTKASGALNIYEDSDLEIPLNIIGTAKEISSAQFIQAGLSARDYNETLVNKYKIEVIDNRTLSVTPRNEVLLDDTYTGSYANYAKSLAGTIKGYIKLTFADGSELVTLTPYTLKISATAPSVKASDIKFNSFYVNQTQSIVFSGKNITVTKAKIDASKATSKTPASPNWISMADNGKSLVLENSMLTSSKASGKTNLNVWLEGYRFPAQVAVKVSSAYSVPKIALSAKTISVPANVSQYLSTVDNAVLLKIVSGDKKVDYSSLNITSLRLANAADRASLSESEKTKYLATDNYNLSSSFIAETGEFKLYAKSGVNQFISGKVMLIATIGGKIEQEIKLSVDVKAIANGSITASANVKKVTINPGLGHYVDELESSIDKKPVSIITNATGFDIGKLSPVAAEKQLTYKIVNPKNKQENWTSELTILQESADRNQLYIRANKNTAHKDYLVQFVISGVTNIVEVPVTVAVTTPKLTASKTNITMDRVLYENTGKVPVSVSLGNTGYEFDDYAMSNLDVSIFNGTSPVDSSILYSTKNWDYKDKSKGTVTIGLGSNAVAGTYKAVLTYTMPNGSKIAPVSIKITVKQTTPSWKAGKSTVTINKKLASQGLDAAYVKMALTGGKLTGASPDYVVKNSKGKVLENGVAYLIVTYDSDTQNLCIKPNMSCEYGATYKLEVKSWVRTNTDYSGTYLPSKPATITVKVAKDDNTDKAISSSLKANGKIDLSRNNSSVVITNTYTNWNKEILDATAENKPVVKWKVYAKNGKTAYNGDYRVGDTANEGIVASSDDASASWFVDADSSDYEIALAANREGEVWANNAINPALKYTLEVLTVFPKYKNGTEDLVVKSSTSFTVTAGTVKASLSQSAVSLSKINKNDSKIVVINLNDKDIANAAQIDKVLIEKAGQSQIEATLLFATNEKAYVVIGWKNNTLPSNPKKETVKLQIYLKGNDSAKNKPNAKVSMTVNAF